MNTSFQSTRSLTGRTHYQSSGSVSFHRLLPWMTPALAAAAALAVFMYWLFHVGHYYIIIVPLICALGIAGLTRLAIAKGHCRNRLAGAFMGFLLAMVLYPGSYYVGMVHQFGADMAARPDLLPQYIRFRIATDVIRDSHGNDEPERVRRGSHVMNGVRFSIELIGVTAIIVVAGYRRSQKAYCEQCQCWLARDVTMFSPEQTAPLLDSLESASARALAMLCATAPHNSLPNTTLAIEYCPSLKTSIRRDCPVYLSLKSVIANAKGATLDEFEQAKGKLLENRVLLNPDELPALALRFPFLESSAGRVAVSALLAETQSSRSPEESQDAGPKEEITNLSPDFNGKVLTRKMAWQGNALALLGVIAFIGGLGLLAWGASILERDRIGPSQKTSGIVLCATGGTSVLVALIGILCDSTFGGNRLLRKRFVAQVATRTGVLVEPGNPDALFIEVVPKTNWGRNMLDTASDVGLLVIDKSRREIRFEGDKERWRLPAGRISQCDVEHYTHGQGLGATKLYYVVLRVNRHEGFWEAPIRERRGVGILNSKRRKRARKLAAAIDEIRGAPAAHAPKMYLTA